MDNNFKHVKEMKEIGTWITDINFVGMQDVWNSTTNH